MEILSQETISFKISYIPVQKGHLWWKKWESRWRVIQVSNKSYNFHEKRVIIQEEDVVGCFNQYEKHKALELVLKLTRELERCSG